MRGHRAGSRDRRRSWPVLVVAIVMPLLVACGATRPATPGQGTVTTASGQAATVAAPAAAGGLVRAVPLDGHALGGHDRLGTPGLGTLLFFDAAG